MIPLIIITVSVAGTILLLKITRQLNTKTNMKTKDLVEFGNYMMSQERRDRYRETSPEDLEERLSQVSHADIENFKTR